MLVVNLFLISLNHNGFEQFGDISCSASIELPQHFVFVEQFIGDMTTLIKFCFDMADLILESRVFFDDGFDESNSG